VEDGTAVGGTIDPILVATTSHAVQADAVAENAKFPTWWMAWYDEAMGKMVPHPVLSIRNSIITWMDGSTTTQNDYDAMTKP
jgi:hypothetical protein